MHRRPQGDAGPAAGDRPPGRGRGRAREHAGEPAQGEGARRALGRVRRQADPRRPCRSCSTTTASSGPPSGQGEVAAHHARRAAAGSTPAAGSRRRSPASGCRPSRRRSRSAASSGSASTSRSSPARGREVETARVAVETLLEHWPAAPPGAADLELRAGLPRGRARARARGAARLSRRRACRGAGGSSSTRYRLQHAASATTAGSAPGSGRRCWPPACRCCSTP